MNFDDQARLKAAELQLRPTEPKEGERICDRCTPPVALVLDLSRPGYEYRCPKCGNYEEWFELRFLPKPSTTTNQPNPCPKPPSP